MDPVTIALTFSVKSPALTGPAHEHARLHAKRSSPDRIDGSMRAADSRSR